MTQSKKILQRCVIAMAIGTGSFVGGCEDEVVVGGAAPTTVAPVAPQPAAAVAPGNALNTNSDAGTDTPVLSYLDEDFVELDVRNRDPFRRFVTVVRAQETVVQRRVVMPRTSIDEMRLIAIIGGIGTPRAMLRDPSGVGFVVKKDDYIGREEVIQTGGADGMPVTLNWQVARIRSSSGEVVLTRTDPTAPDRPPLTRIIPLHDEEDASQQNLITQ